MANQTPPWIIRPLVPEAVYTDRAEFLDYFYKTALKAATRRTMSTVLLGRRRMGKTEIFRRVVNRLFFEQDPKDPRKAKMSQSTQSVTYWCVYLAATYSNISN